MSMIIRSNLPASYVLRQLNDTTRKLSSTYEKLSSGYRINRSSDDPAGSVLSGTIKARIAGLNQSIENSQIGISMLQNAESSLAEINSVLLRMRELALHAMNTGPNDETMIAADQVEIESCLSTIDRITAETEFGDKRLLDGSRENIIAITDNVSGIDDASDSTLSAGAHEIEVSDWIAANQSIDNNSLGLYEPTFPHGLEAGEHTINVIQESGPADFRSGTLFFEEPIVIEDGVNDQFLFSLDAADPVTIDLSTGTTLSFNDAESLAVALESAVKEALGGDPDDEIRVVANDDDTISFMTTDHGVESIISISDTGLDTSALQDLHLDAGTVYGINAIVTLDNFENEISNVDNATPTEIVLKDSQDNDITFQITDSSSGLKSGTAILTVNPESFLVSLDGGPRFEFRTNEWGVVYNGNESIRLLFHEHVAEGINLIDTRVNALTFNIGTEKDFYLEGVSPASLGLRDGRLSTIDLSTRENAEAALAAIDAATERVSSERSRLGAFMNDVLEEQLNNMMVEVENLSAAESIITDTDYAESLAEMTKYQIMQQAQTAILAQANMTPESVLKLLS